MKNLVNKSRLFKRAWSAYRNSQSKKRTRTFSSCLKWSWKLEKENAAFEARKNDWVALVDTYANDLQEVGKSYLVNLTVSTKSGNQKSKKMYFGKSVVRLQNNHVLVPYWLLLKKNNELDSRYYHGVEYYNDLEAKELGVFN